MGRVVFARSIKSLEGRCLWLRRTRSYANSIVGRSGIEVCSDKRERCGASRSTQRIRVRRVVSCGQRWRTKLNLRSRECFDDGHRGTALRTAPSVVERSGGSISLELLFWRSPQCLEAKRQGGGTLAVGQKTEVADAHETFGQQVQQETAQEVIER